MPDPIQTRLEPPQRGVSPFVKVFVFFHIVAITSWALPHSTVPNPLRFDTESPKAMAKSIGDDISNGVLYVNEKYVRNSPTRFYLLYSGFWQYWDMFSPNPSNTDFYCTAVIKYQDGTSKDYQYPRMYLENIAQKYVTERYRKFYERVNPDDDAYVWPYFAQRLALINYTDLNNPPVEVKVTRHWYVIQAPEQQGYANLLSDWAKQHPGKQIDAESDKALHKQAHDNSVQLATEDNYKHYEFYDFKVDQMKLKQDKALGPLG